MRPLMRWARNDAIPAVQRPIRGAMAAVETFALLRRVEERAVGGRHAVADVVGGIVMPTRRLKDCRAFWQGSAVACPPIGSGDEGLLPPDGEIRRGAWLWFGGGGFDRGNHRQIHRRRRRLL